MSDDAPDRPSDDGDRDRRVDDADLTELLADLESTLTELREEVGPAGGPPRPPRRLRPPTPREVLRFTEEYTIPTLIAVLEANVRLLELLQGVLRATDPEKSVAADAGARATERGRAATKRLAAGLDELQAALADADLPENPEARRLLSDARDLSTEIQGRIAEGREVADEAWDRERREGRESRADTGDRGDSAGVSIAVRDAAESGDSGGGETADDGDETDDGADVDVESELQSIKDEMGDGEDDLDDEAADPAAEPSESDDADDEDDLDDAA